MDLKLLFGNYSKKELKRINPIANKVLALEEEFRALSDTELQAMTPRLKERLAKGETLDDILPEAFATCREASDRVLGMRHFPVQVVGGIVLHQGRISEMKTGEGKTLVATLPAYLNALSGDGVHIVTVNDYLAKRDSEWMGKVYNFLGLTVGLVVHAIEPGDRKPSYQADITYGTNNEFGFDYLRDNMVTYKERKAQRGFNFAIVDEVDSILIDEARTPLIISGQGEKSSDLYERADRFARGLKINRIREMDSKDDIADFEGDILVDEKARSASLTPVGIAKAEKFFGLENLADSENLTIEHHINQAIRAHGVMQLDVDYVVRDNQVIIVDEFTGRLMFGRRYNEGLHQAIEAKEHVKVEHESKTLATITFQNFFRLYKKLSGMTGTAMTEDAEFREIYKLDVIEIPTNKPAVRADNNDVIYKTESGKFNAVIDQIIECNKKGQPVLVGTISIEKSEHLSKLLKRRGVKHSVLNAKYHEKEADIVSQAGKKGAVTIATNMAGRGTDIMLGGNAEYLAKDEMRRLEFTEELIVEATGFSATDDEEILNARKTYLELNSKYKAKIKPEAEEVKAAGGLYIIGTERHESRRIDNQLRGRSGRQGDPGESRFYVSLEDDLMRRFGGERVQNIMDSLGVEEDMPLETKILSNSIEGAQRKVESQNFAIRKNVLQFDDVMNRQREVIYGQRNKVLEGENVRDSIVKMIDDTINSQCDQRISDHIHDNWNLSALREYFMGWLTTDKDFKYNAEELGDADPDEIRQTLTDRAHKIYADKEAEYGEDLMRELERVILLRNVDSKWMDHIDAMDELRQSIHMRSYGQQDPVIEYRSEGFDMFNAMTELIREDACRMILTAKIKKEEEVKREQLAKPSYASGTDTGKGVTVRREGKNKKVGVNAPCPCGSGRKYKKCCGMNA